MFVKGDKVIDVLKGHGKVEDINKSDEFPIYVEFNSPHCGFESYTADGRLDKRDIYPSLYHADGFVMPVPGKEPSRLEDGTLIWVWDGSYKSYAVLAFFDATITSEGKIIARRNSSAGWKAWDNGQVYKPGQTMPE